MTTALETEYRETVARLNDATKRLGTIARSAPERDDAKRDVEALAKRIGELKEARKRENMRRNFAGMGTPLYEAILARFGANVARELEDDAMQRQEEREARAAERRASKQGAA